MDAPSHATGRLHVAGATPSSVGLELTLAQTAKLGFPASVIAKHPTKPLPYVAPPGGPAGQARGAVITLQSDRSYARHAEVNSCHPCAWVSLDRTRLYLLGADNEQGFVEVYALEAEGMVEPNRTAGGIECREPIPSWTPALLRLPWQTRISEPKV